MFHRGKEGVKMDQNFMKRKEGAAAGIVNVFADDAVDADKFTLQYY